MSPNARTYKAKIHFLPRNRGTACGRIGVRATTEREGVTCKDCLRISQFRSTIEHYLKEKQDA
jgi:hypothetical protein